MSRYPLVDAAAKYCWSKNGQEIFQAFYLKHASTFRDAPQLQTGGEQDLEYYSLFQEYLKLYEDTLSDYIGTLGVDVEEFYLQLSDVKEDPAIKDKKLLHFVNYLVGCTDYPSFYKMMVRAAKKIAKEEAELEAARAALEASGGAGGREAKGGGGGGRGADEKADSKRGESKDDDYGAGGKDTGDGDSKADSK